MTSSRQKVKILNFLDPFFPGLNPGTFSPSVGLFNPMTGTPVNPFFQEGIMDEGDVLNCFAKCG
jgi:hypothetical protein